MTIKKVVLIIILILLCLSENSKMYNDIGANEVELTEKSHHSEEKVLELQILSIKLQLTDYGLVLSSNWTYYNP
ncbi:MAG: hypothetical protein JEZ08_06540 [Clostridiales bacterium]|nr:hypothetical protein [Clostridiales bacterium]